MFLVVGLLTGILQSTAGGVAPLMILGGALVIGALIAWGVVAAIGPMRLSRTTTLIIGVAIPALFALLIAGAGYALIGSLGGASGPSSQPGRMIIDLRGPVQARAEVDAVCEFGTSAQDGFGVHAAYRVGGGREMSIDLTVHPGPGEGRDVFVNIARAASDPNAAASWSNEDPTAVQLNGAVDYVEGNVSFSDLSGFGPNGQRVDPLSGEISWTCD